MIAMVGERVVLSGFLLYEVGSTTVILHDRRNSNEKKTNTTEQHVAAERRVEGDWEREQQHRPISACAEVHRSCYRRWDHAGDRSAFVVLFIQMVCSGTVY